MALYSVSIEGVAVIGNRDFTDCALWTVEDEKRGVLMIRVAKSSEAEQRS